MQKEFKDLQLSLREIFNNAFLVKNRVEDNYEFLIDREISEAEKNPLDTIESKYYTQYINDYLTKASSQAKECLTEI